MENAKIYIQLDDKGMRVRTQGTCVQILKGLALIAINITAEMQVLPTKIWREALCNMIMDAPTNGDNNG